MHLKSFQQFVLESFSSPEYDEILDLYSEVGKEGMTQDEIEYLQSGGETELPKRFKTELSQQKYDNHASGNNFNEVKLNDDDWSDIFSLNEIIKKSDDEVRVVNNYENAGFYLNVLCSLIFIYDKETMDTLEKLHKKFNLEVKGNNIYYVIPKTWLLHLEIDGGDASDEINGGGNDFPEFI